MLRNIFLFPETLRIWINHLLSFFSLVTVCICIIIAFLNARSIYASFKKWFSSWYSHFRSIFKFQIIWISITLFAWFIISLAFHIMSRTGSSTTIPWDYLYDIWGWETMVQIDERETLFWIKALYENHEIYSKLNIFTWNIALYILWLLLFAGITVTFSFWNRLLLNIAIFKIYLACMLLVGWLLMQYRSNELWSQLLIQNIDPLTNSV